MRIVDWVVTGWMYVWADEEIVHYMGLAAKERKKWLELNDATDAIENLRDSAFACLEGVKKHRNRKWLER
jgi:hypothetical protein